MRVSPCVEATHLLLANLATLELVGRYDATLPAECPAIPQSVADTPLPCLPPSNTVLDLSSALVTEDAKQRARQSTKRGQVPAIWKFP